MIEFFYRARGTLYNASRFASVEPKCQRGASQSANDTLDYSLLLSMLHGIGRDVWGATGITSIFLTGEV